MDIVSVMMGKETAFIWQLDEEPKTPGRYSWPSVKRYSADTACHLVTPSDHILFELLLLDEAFLTRGKRGK